MVMNSELWVRNNWEVVVRRRGFKPLFYYFVDRRNALKAMVLALDVPIVASCVCIPLKHKDN